MTAVDVCPECDGHRVIEVERFVDGRMRTVAERCPVCSHTSLDEAKAEMVSDRLGGFRDTGTQLEAAAAVAPRAGTQRAKVLQALRNSTAGLTDYEVSLSTGIARHVAAKRRGELVKEGLVVDSGHQRDTDTGSAAIVWEAVAVVGE